jgi:hypothetical protein
MYLFLFILFTQAQTQPLSPQEMSFLSEAVAKSLISCKKIQGAILPGDLDFKNASTEPVSKRIFSAKIKQELKKNLGVRFQGDSKKKGILAKATLSSTTSKDAEATTVSYDLKINFSQNKELICEAQNEMTKTQKGSP